jgi:hypothetical protein
VKAVGKLGVAGAMVLSAQWFLYGFARTYPRATLASATCMDWTWSSLNDRGVTKVSTVKKREAGIFSRFGGWHDSRVDAAGCGLQIGVEFMGSAGGFADALLFLPLDRGKHRAHLGATPSGRVLCCVFRRIDGDIVQPITAFEVEE